MPGDRKIGQLDHPERYGSKQLAVYANSKRQYFMLDGVRESVHGSQLWTTLSNVKMRGNGPVYAPNGPGDAPEVAGEDADLEAAIAASLALQEEAMPAPLLEEEEDETAPVEAPVQDGASAAGAGNGVRECCICLTEAVDTLLRPCNHLVACSGCARRLARHPCPVCRRPVRSVERVFF